MTIWDFHFAGSVFRDGFGRVWLDKPTSKGLFSMDPEGDDR